MAEVGDYIKYKDEVWKVINKYTQSTYDKDNWSVSSDESEDKTNISIKQNETITSETNMMTIWRFYEEEHIEDTGDEELASQDDIDAFTPIEAQFNDEMSRFKVSIFDIEKYGYDVNYFISPVGYFIDDSNRLHIKTRETKDNMGMAFNKYRDTLVDLYDSPYGDGGMYYVFQL